VYVYVTRSNDQKIILVLIMLMACMHVYINILKRFTYEHGRHILEEIRLYEKQILKLQSTNIC
jgi:hypothetical protein